MNSKKLISYFVFITFAITSGCMNSKSIKYELDSTTEVSNIHFAGVRSSNYGIKPFPDADEWTISMTQLSKNFHGATPCAIWIVGVLKDSNKCFLEFPSDGKLHKKIIFNDQDKHEDYLEHFDKAGIKLFLQVEPANACVSTLIDLVLKRYSHHKCVIGLGIDVEWHRESERKGLGVPVTDDSAKVWETKVKFYNPNYRLFLKHWDREWMPKKYRGDIIFVSDSQMLKDYHEMLDEFVVYWSDYFEPNPVFFQIGYRSDRKWWRKLENPPRDIGLAIAQNIQQECGIFWVDFTLREIMADTSAQETSQPDN